MKRYVKNCWPEWSSRGTGSRKFARVETLSRPFCVVQVEASMHREVCSMM